MPRFDSYVDIERSGRTALDVQSKKWAAAGGKQDLVDLEEAAATHPYITKKFRIGSDFVKHSFKTYWKGWIFLIINKEMIPLWLCKLLLKKWSGLWGAVNVHKINTCEVCLLHSKANTAAMLAWIGLGDGIGFPPLKREKVCCADLMVSSRTSTLHCDSLDMVVDEHKFQVTKRNRHRVLTFLWVRTSPLSYLWASDSHSCDYLLLFQEWMSAACNKFEN